MDETFKTEKKKWFNIKGELNNFLYQTLKVLEYIDKN